MRIYVTGGSGFLGRRLVPALKETCGGCNVKAPSSAEVNLLDYGQTLRSLAEWKPDLVIHLAADMAGIGELMKRPLPYLENNLLMNFNIVKAALEVQTGKMITMGSSCSYNDKTPLPMMEEYFWKHRPENTYGVCKLILLEHLMAQSEMSWVYLIPGNLYGPGDHFGESNAHLIPATILKFESAIRQGCPDIPVWGDGSQIRDFLFVDDLVRVICRAVINRAYEGIPMNVSLKGGYSIRQVVEMLREIMGLKEIGISWEPEKPTGIMKKVLDNGRFLKVEPGFEFTSLEQGLKAAVDDYKRTREARG